MNGNTPGIKGPVNGNTPGIKGPMIGVEVHPQRTSRQRGNGLVGALVEPVRLNLPIEGVTA
jgi:hypothetical protein